MHQDLQLLQKVEKDGCCSLIKKEPCKFTVSDKKYFLLSILCLLVITFIFVLIYYFENFQDPYVVLYLIASLGNLLLFTRINRRPVAYFWVKKNKFSKFILLNIEGDYLPVRFFISHIYFYVQLLIGISLYLFIMSSSIKETINIKIFTYWLIGIFNMLPFIAFAVIEVIENNKCKDLKL